MITAGGENIAPVPIESRFRQALPELVSNCILVGDRRKFLALLVTLRVEPDPETLAPTDRLSADAQKALAKHCQLTVGTVSEVMEGIAKSKELRSKLELLFQNALDTVNSQVYSIIWKVFLRRIVMQDFSVVA